MNGEIAQFVALVCHGNAILAKLPFDHFFPENSTCRWCSAIRFVAGSRRLFSRRSLASVAATPDDWFVWLAKREARAIELVYQSQGGVQVGDKQVPDRMLAAFIGQGGAWSMRVRDADGKCDTWMAMWSKAPAPVSDKRIWRVDYAMVARNAEIPLTPAALGPSRDRLARALREVQAFSERHGHESFSECFAKALDSLASHRMHGYHQDLAPPGTISDDAAAILDAAQSAWVFGGMGFWNDLYHPEDQSEYDRVSEQLYAALTGAIAVAASSSCHRWSGTADA